MPKCDVRVVLDRPDRTYSIGEKVSGVVEVTVEDTCRCNALTLALGWRTRGKGNPASGGGDTELLFSGIWYPGAVARYPFEFPAPPGPLTYSGTHFGVDWYVRARADIPWKLDPKQDEVFTLIPGDAPGEVDHGPRYRPPEARRSQAGVLAAIGLVVAMVSVASFFTLYLRADSDSPRWVLLLLSGCSLAGVAGVAVWFGLRQMVRRRLGPVDLRVAPTLVRPGESIACSLRFRPTTTVSLDGVFATLRGREVVVRGGGKHQSFHRHTVHEEKMEMASSSRPMPGEEVDLEASLPLPEDAPFTFVAASNSLKWSVTVRIAMRGWPDWVREHPITVKP